MTTFITFRLFLACLLSCATLVLIAIWLQDRITSPLYFQCTATCFVIGLASFLVWFSLTLKEMYTSMRGKG
jgi:hypothetical protein